MGILSRILDEIRAREAPERASRAAVRILDEVVSLAAGRRVRTHARAPWERALELDERTPPPPVSTVPVASTSPASSPVAVAPVATAPVVAAPVVAAPVVAAPVVAAPVVAAPVVAAPVVGASVPAAAPIAAAPVASAAADSTAADLPVVPARKPRPRARIWSGENRAGEIKRTPQPQAERTDRSDRRDRPAQPAQPKSTQPPTQAKTTQPPVQAKPAQPPAQAKPAQPPAQAKPAQAKTTQPPQQASSALDPIPSLPARSGPDRVVLLARDPFFGHAYWELSPERIHRAIKELGGKARGVLRLIDIEHGDILAAAEVYAEHGRYILRFPAGDRRYGVELAMQSEDERRTIVMLHSNVVMVPPCLPREKGDVVFVDLNPQREILANAMNLARPPRLRTDCPDPAKPRRPPPTSSIEFAKQAAANAAREGCAHDALAVAAAGDHTRINESSSHGGGGSEARLAKREDEGEDKGDEKRA